MSIAIRRVDHLSLTVGDVDAAAAFYAKAFGATERYRLGPIAADQLPRSGAKDWTEAHLGIPGATLTIVMLDLTPDLGLELFQYDAPAHANAAPLPPNATGACHIGLMVDDVEDAARRLAALGCRVTDATIDLPEGPTADKLFRYLADPFGNTLELVQQRTTP